RRSPPDAVERTDGPADDGHPGAPHAPGGGDARVAEHRTEEARADARGVLDRARRPEQLGMHLPRHAEGVQPVVTIAVQPERVAGRMNLPDDVGMTTRLRPQ